MSPACVHLHCLHVLLYFDKTHFERAAAAALNSLLVKHYLRAV